MRLLAAWVIAIAIGLALGDAARAETSPPSLGLDEPRSGLHLDVEGACQVRPEDGGGAGCRDFAASADKSEVFAIVRGPAGLLFYSVAMFAEREPGDGEARARRVSAHMGDSVVGVPAAVTFGEQRFLRAELRTPKGAALCFITVDDRPEVAIVMFASELQDFAAMQPRAEAGMRTVRREPAPAVTAAAPAGPTPMSWGSRALLSTFLVVLFGLPVVAFIRRAVRLQAKRAGRRTSDD